MLAAGTRTAAERRTPGCSRSAARGRRGRQWCSSGWGLRTRHSAAPTSRANWRCERLPTTRVAVIAGEVCHIPYARHVSKILDQKWRSPLKLMRWRWTLELKRKSLTCKNHHHLQAVACRCAVEGVAGNFGTR